MTVRLQQLCNERHISPEESRNIGLLTIFSKLVLALVMGIFVMVVSLMN